MRRHYYIRAALIILLFAAGHLRTGCAQSRPYVKYGSSGETIGLFHLLKDPNRCATWHAIAGKIITVRSHKRKKEFDYQLTLSLDGRFRIFVFSVGVDEIPRADITNLVMKGRGIKLRACEGASFLLVEEITRL
jgi:hypothetical protein